MAKWKDTAGFTFRKIEPRALVHRGSGAGFASGGTATVPRGERWTAYGDAEYYRRSLERLMELDVDFLLPNKSQDVAPPPIPFGRASRERAAADVKAALQARHAGRARRAPAGA
jgi:hypothetical protein